MPGMHTDEQVAGWRRVTDAVHAGGGRIVLQLVHHGRWSHSSYNPDGSVPVAPSAIAPPGKAYTAQGIKLTTRRRARSSSTSYRRSLTPFDQRLGAR
jgi:2,4-dienoyl-CoA reductase-like NADH-dependent reductase (Old Yellow Enzyme family)